MAKFTTPEEFRALLASIARPSTPDDHHRACEVYWSVAGDTCFVAPVHTNADGIALHFSDDAVTVPRNAASVEAAVLAALARSGPTSRQPEKFRGWRRHFNAHFLVSVHDNKRGQLVVEPQRSVARGSYFEPTGKQTCVPTAFEPGSLFNAIAAGIELVRR